MFHINGPLVVEVIVVVGRGARNDKKCKYMLTFPDANSAEEELFSLTHLSVYRLLHLSILHIIGYISLVLATHPV